MTPSPVRNMNEPDTATDISLIAQVVLAERQGRDRGWWEQMAAAYWPDSTVRLSWYDGDGAGFVRGSEAMARRGAVALHHLCAPVVHVRGTRAHVELSLSMRIAIDVDGVEANLISYTRLNYRLERRGQHWRIKTLAAVYEYATLEPAVPGQIIEIPLEDLVHYRKSYALLAWNIAREGRVPSDDELGDDRPDELATFYADIETWLNTDG